MTTADIKLSNTSDPVSKKERPHHQRMWSFFLIVTLLRLQGAVSVRSRGARLRCSLWIACLDYLENVVKVLFLQRGNFSIMGSN